MEVLPRCNCDVAIMKLYLVFAIVVFSALIFSGSLWWRRRVTSNPRPLLKKTDEKLMNIENPGCQTRELRSYKAPEAGKTYHHPPIVHYAKLSESSNNTECTLTFRDYISVLSTYKFLKPKRLFFHTYMDLSGKYWNTIKSWKTVQVTQNKIPRVIKIGGRETIYVQHQADYVKLSMVYKYGGTALDFDVIMINGSRWRQMQARSECVLNKQTDTLNGGLYSCIPKSSFVSKWLEGYHKDYQPKYWLYNASSKPRYLLTNRKSSICYNVHVEETVSLSPNWERGKDWLKHGGVKWRNKTAAHYFVKNGIPNDGEGLLHEDFSLAELIKYVYNA